MVDRMLEESSTHHSIDIIRFSCFIHAIIILNVGNTKHHGFVYCICGTSIQEHLFHTPLQPLKII